MMNKEVTGFNGLRTGKRDYFMTPAARFDSYSGSRQSARAMRSAIWSVVLVLALGACGSKAPASGVSAAQGASEWVCRPEGDTWDCAQGAEPPPPAEPDQE